MTDCPMCQKWQDDADLQPGEMNRNPDRVQDQQLDRDFQRPRRWEKRKIGKQEGVDRVGLGIDELKQRTGTESRRVIGAAESNRTAGTGDTQCQVSQVKQ